MKKQIIKLTLIALITPGLYLPLAGCEKENIETQEGKAAGEPGDQDPEAYIFSYLSQIPKEELSKAEIDGLIFLREEEKLARDVYLTLNEAVLLRSLQNISKSEQQHMDAIKYLLERYELDDPVANNEIGVFKNPELQELFDKLTEQGKVGATEALKVGALIEEKDIYDLKEELENTVDNKDIEFVYQNLLRGSENHLRAFTRVLSRYGVKYTPVILDEEHFNVIIGE